MQDDDNELYELDKHTASAYAFLVAVPERTGTPVVRVACQRHTDPAYLPFRARALTTTTPPAAAVVSDVWSMLEFIERHELEAHGAVARPVPYLPVNEADATAVLPVLPEVAPPAPPLHHPSVHVVAVPNGAAGAMLPGARVQLRHRSARPVVVRSIRLADGSHLVTLPADGFPGATWELRTPAYVAPEHSPATGPARYVASDHAADVCGRCGADVRKDQARDVLPPPYGSLNAAYPLTLCGSCSDGLVDLVAAYVAPATAPATGPAAETDPATAPGMRPGMYCRPCDVYVGFGAAGIVRVPEDRADDRDWLASHCWMCKRSNEQIVREDYAPSLAPHEFVWLGKRNGNGMEVVG